ncbi:hypothetical protein [Protaetiibacter larvae]|uniref:Uncharacterized protein n=1 Tax=Protaetiibacter larvae TaxID=2592654 RepID=A0A5C1Y9Z4_9MICO|nr:hypothetical protein [Protaetiibacter larvae]QEO09712.1 hypothetical protein FLP23_06655 [Protaetiibacter larvae]
MNPRAARLARGTLLGTVATLVAALSHSGAGGTVPAPIALLVGGMFASLVGTIAVGRTSARRTPLMRTALGVAVGQLAFHLGFSLLGGAGTVVGHGGHHHDTIVAIVADPDDALAHGGGAMWLAHLAAGVLTVLYLRHLERRVWLLLEHAAVRALRALALRLPTPASAATPFAASPTVRLLPAPLRGAVARRGPPAALA